MILVVHCRKLQTSEEQMTIPTELIPQAEEISVNTTVRDSYLLDVMTAPRKCMCLKMNVWRNGLEVMLKCASRHTHGVIHHNYKNGRKEKPLSGSYFLTVQFGPTVVCYRK